MLSVTLILALFSPQPAFASYSSLLEPGTPQTNGTVFDMAQAGDRTIIGGSFTRAGGQPRLTLAAILANGSVDPTFAPSTDGKVYAVAVSADGSRIFIGGAFTTVNGQPRANLAALDLQGNLDPDWRADITGDYAPTVRSLFVKGSDVYVGGRFTWIEKQPRKNLAKVTATTGDVVLAFSPRPDKIVWDVVTSPDGTKVYAGGEFTRMATTARPFHIAELHASTGAPTAWNPAGWDHRVLAVAVHPSGGRLYIGTELNYLVAYDLTQTRPPWWKVTEGNIQAIAVSPTEVYFGGHFGRVYYTTAQRSYLASVTLDGQYTSWNPYLSGLTSGVWTILLQPTRISVGGHFNLVGGVTQRYFARFTGTP